MCFDDCPNGEYSEQFVDLWTSQAHHKMNFRYGYVDAKHADNLLVTKRPP